MLESITSPKDVLALKLSGAITGAELEMIMSRLDEIMADRDKVHLFIETQGLSGFELSSLPHYWARALPLLGKLHKFGRVAVVADQAWVRLAARLESAMLPFITYRTYESDQRDEACDWVYSGEDLQKG